MSEPQARKPAGGAQRLSLDALGQWQALEYGLRLSFGMPTFTSGSAGVRASRQPLARYAPGALDVESWVELAAEAGMQYVSLTVKAGGGFALWPTRTTEYSIAQIEKSVDVVGAFVGACREHGVLPVFDFGSETAKTHPVHGHTFGLPMVKEAEPAIQDARFRDYCEQQLNELLTGYGSVAAVRFAHPELYSLTTRRHLYDTAVHFQPDIVVCMDAGPGGRDMQVKPSCWPTDVHVLQDGPPPFSVHDGWRTLGPDVTGRTGPVSCFLPAEAVMRTDRGVGDCWFGGESAVVCSPEELLGMRLLCRTRGANCVFNVPPTPDGTIRQDYRAALLQVRRMWEEVGA